MLAIIEAALPYVISIGSVASIGSMYAYIGHKVEYKTPVAVTAITCAAIVTGMISPQAEQNVDYEVTVTYGDKHAEKVTENADEHVVKWTPEFVSVAKL